MERTEIIEHLRGALATVLHRDIPELAEDTRLFEDLALDSTGSIELLLDLDDRMNLEFGPDDLDDLEPEALRTVGSVADYIESSLKKAAAV